MASNRRHFLSTALAAVGAGLLGPRRPAAAGAKRQGRTSMDEPSPQDAAAEDRAPGYVRLARSGELQKREQALYAKLKACDLCPRTCGDNRIRGERGLCGAGVVPELASAGPHFGEEPPLVGRGGSGTVFLSRCNLLCVFCQNWEIAHLGRGRPVEPEALAQTMLALQRRGCHNINWVTPSHQLPGLLRALRLAAASGLRIPLVYNTGGYDALETLRLLDGVVDIYLPDFKYQDGEQAARYSAGAEDYPEKAAAAVAEMQRQVGTLDVDARGVARRGLLIRHLVMPHGIAGSERFVRWVARELGTDTAVNIMGQYHPAHQAHAHPRIARPVNAEEVAAARRAAREAGLTNLID